MSFVPKVQEGLLIRSPLTYGFISPSSFYHPKPIYTKDTAKTHVLGQKDQHVLMKNHHTRNINTRNNPHPFHVRHMKGLLGVPVCSVEDQVEPRCLLSPPTGRDFGSAFRPKGSTRYSANINKGIPAVGVVPVTMTWRDELESKTQNAIMKAMGQSSTFRSGLDNEEEVRKRNQLEDLSDDKLLEYLCRILLTDSIPACQAWLAAAAESEKAIVLNMIKMAACGALKDTSIITSARPQTSKSQTQYVWYPEKCKPKKFQPSNMNRTISEEKEEFSFPSLKKIDKSELEELPPNFPMSDNVIRMVQNLSRQASREWSITSPGMLRQPSKEAEKIEQLEKWPDKIPKHSHRHSASLTTSTSSGRARSAVIRSSSLQRIKSMCVPSGGENGNVQRPQPPVKVCATKETLHSGSSRSARLRYTSHWKK